MFEIEIDGAHNESFHFRPIGRNVRGKFDLVRETEPLAMMKRGNYPFPIPSQRLGIDMDRGEGYIAEPLYAEEHAAVREKILERGWQLPPECERFEGIDIPTWVYWIKRAVNSGLARIVRGSLPTVAGEPKKSFITSQPSESREDRMIMAIERQNELMAQLLAKLAEK